MSSISFKLPTIFPELYTFQTENKTKNCSQRVADLLLCPARVAFGETITIERRTLNIKKGTIIEKGWYGEGPLSVRNTPAHRNQPEFIQVDRDNPQYSSFKTRKNTHNMAVRIFAAVAAFFLTPLTLMGYAICRCDKTHKENRELYQGHFKMVYKLEGTETSQAKLVCASSDFFNYLNEKARPRSIDVDLNANGNDLSFTGSSIDKEVSNIFSNARKYKLIPAKA